MVDFNNLFGSVVGPLDIFVSQTIDIGFKILLAYVIWVIGKWLIGLAAKAIDLLDVKEWNFDDHIRSVIKKVFVPVANVVLILIILDTLGIGSNVVSAIVNGLTFTVAIALGLAFGRAMEDDARQIVGKVRAGVKK